LNVSTEFILTMVPEGPPRGNYIGIEGHHLPISTFKEVVNINVVSQSAQPWINADWRNVARR
jgi:hypothetical protein